MKTAAFNDSSETLIIPIVGVTPLIVRRFPDGPQPKTSKAEYEASFYRLNDGRPGMVVGAFKAATIGGARVYPDLKTTEVKSFLWFQGEPGDDGRMMVPIEGKPGMREDVVRVGRGVTCSRYRPQFLRWKTSLTVTYSVANLTRESVLLLVKAGGMLSGVGEWRPEKGGEFGKYCVDPDKEVEVIG